MNGQETAPRGQKTREVLGVQVRVEDLLQNVLVHPVRDLNYRFLVAEWLWIMAGRDDVETLAKYNGEMRKFSDNGRYLAGAYGPRLRSAFVLKPDGTTWAKCEDQLTWCVQKLREDPDSRQAVATIWTPCPGQSKDVPCTVSVQFLLRQETPFYESGRLHAIWTMRSSDAWLGFPYDFFTFSMITNCVAGELGAKPGSLIMNLGSSHLYEEHWAKATELIARWQEAETVLSPQLPGLPTTEAFNTMLDPGFARPPWNMYSKALQVKYKISALEVLKNATS
jgi:thymidylate synthase